MMLADHFPALQVGVTLLTAPLAVVLRDPRLAWLTAVAASATAFAVAVSLTSQVLVSGEALHYPLGGWSAPYGIELVVDAASAILLLLVTGASTAALLAGAAGLFRDLPRERLPLFMGAWLLAISGLSGIVISGDAFNVFVFMEISSLASYVLIAGGGDRRALPAVFKYLMAGTIGATLYLIGVGLLYAMTGTLNFTDLKASLPEVTALAPVLAAAGFITVGMGLKAAVFPMHAWLPGAYTWAPHAVTAFLAACSTKVALLVLLRFDFFLFQAHVERHTLQFSGFALPLACLGILVASYTACQEPQLKRLLAWSSIAQISYILLGAGLATHEGVSAALLHTFNHGLAKGALFLAICLLALRRDSLTLTSIQGLGRQMPWTSSALLVAGLSLVGVPGTAGFISKWALLAATVQWGALGWLLAAVIVISSLMSAFYVWLIVDALWFGQSAEQSSADAAREAPAAALAVVWLAALLNIYFGLQSGLPLRLAEQAATRLLGGLL